MTQASADRITLFVAALGLCTTLIAFFAFGAEAATSTGVGATLGFANLLALRRLVGRITEGGLAGKGLVVVLLFAKMGALMGLVFLVIARKWVEPIPFVVGLSTLVVGLITAALFVAGKPADPTLTPHTSSK